LPRASIKDRRAEGLTVGPAPLCNGHVSACPHELGKLTVGHLGDIDFESSNLPLAADALLLTESDTATRHAPALDPNLPSDRSATDTGRWCGSRKTRRSLA
jgi:hypothetical protein